MSLMEHPYENNRPCDDGVGHLSVESVSSSPAGPFTKNRSNHMRRKDREITDEEEILQVLNKCNTVRIGMIGEDGPYVVPVTPAVTCENGKTVVYFHCAKAEGKMVKMLRQDAHVCVEGDVFLGIQTTEHGITTRYQSVIGFGKAALIKDSQEVVRALQLLVTQYGFTDYPLNRCKGIPRLYIVKIILERITGKQNLPAPKSVPWKI